MYKLNVIITITPAFLCQTWSDDSKMHMSEKRVNNYQDSPIKQFLSLKWKQCKCDI